MTKVSHVGKTGVGIVLFVACALVLPVRLGRALASESSSPDTTALPCRDGGDDCINIGFTEAWFEGQTVQLEYSHPFFCDRQPHNFFFPSKNFFFPQCEAGEPATTLPPSGPVVSEAYLVIPVGFSPPVSTLHCPIPGRCIDHPHTMSLPRLVGRGNQNAILPAHSIVIEDQEAFQSTWWPVVLVFVKTLDAWNTIAAAKSIAAVDDCQTNGGCFPEVETNAFLFFQVLGPGMSPQGPA